MDGFIYLEDGSKYFGKGFGAKGFSCGELVFNTSITGYEEILTDPSYAGQIVTMTYPLIGNYGVNKYEMESKKIYARGMIVKGLWDSPSNYMSEGGLSQLLSNEKITGVCDVDTRSITKKIRNSGAMKCIVSSENLPMEQVKYYMNNYTSGDKLIEDVSTKQIVHVYGKKQRVAVLDFGTKTSIIKNLKSRDCDVYIFPYNTSPEVIMACRPDGLMLSNGPGDPKSIPETVENVKKFIGKLPIFGICLGHQILALSLGGNTFKMKYGHRGANHGVYDIDIKRAYITSQNHGFAVNEESLQNKDIIITHKNLNDDSVEGMKHAHLPIFSVQFHPEGGPGPSDSAYLFDKFLKLMA